MYWYGKMSMLYSSVKKEFKNSMNSLLKNCLSLINSIIHTRKNVWRNRYQLNSSYRDNYYGTLSLSIILVEFCNVRKFCNQEMTLHFFLIKKCKNFLQENL